jgi:hypothetical protein
MNSFPIPDIDPVELLLGSIGIRPIISRNLERIKVSDIDEMIRIPTKVTRMSRQLIRGDKFELTFGRDSYRDLLKDLARGWDVEQAQEMLAAVPRDMKAIASALLVKSIKLIETMDKEYPRSDYATIAGTDTLKPSGVKMFRFLSVLEVIDRPLIVFELMACGGLSQSQVEAVRTVYPTLSAAIDAAIIDAVVRARAEKKSYQLPPRAETGVKAWFGKSPVPLQQMARGQEVAKMEGQKELERKQAIQDQKQNKAHMTTLQKAESAG